MTTLQERVQEDDVKDLPDWEVANILNAPDTTLPEIVILRSRTFGVGAIIEIFGPIEGPAFLERMEQLSSSDPLMKWTLLLLKNGNLDAASPTLREAIDQMIATNVISASHGNQIKALAEERRYPSWAEYNNIEVTARTVGLARGAI